MIASNTLQQMQFEHKDTMLKIFITKVINNFLGTYFYSQYGTELSWNAMSTDTVNKTYDLTGIVKSVIDKIKKIAAGGKESMVVESWRVLGKESITNMVVEFAMNKAKIYCAERNENSAQFIVDKEKL